VLHTSGLHALPEFGPTIDGFHVSYNAPEMVEVVLPQVRFSRNNTKYPLLLIAGICSYLNLILSTIYEPKKVPPGNLLAVVLLYH
jgi:hypothetical protein